MRSVDVSVGAFPDSVDNNNADFHKQVRKAAAKMDAKYKHLSYDQQINQERSFVATMTPEKRAQVSLERFLDSKSERDAIRAS